MLKRACLLGVLVTITCVCQSEAVSPRRILEVADITGPVVSPDGTQVAFRVEQASIERNTYDSAWYVQDINGVSPPHQVADGGIPLRDYSGVSLPAAALWSPDGRWIYYRALIDGRIEVWRAAADGSDAQAVTADPADVRDFSLSPDGGILKYSVGAARENVIDAEQSEYDRGIRIDKAVPIGQGLFRSGYVEGRFATQRFNGGDTARVPLLAQVPDHWRGVDLATRTTRDLEPAEIPREPAARDLTQASGGPWKEAKDPNSGRIARLTRVGDRNGLLDAPDVELTMQPDGKSRSLVKCEDELCTKKAITDVQWRPGSDEILFTVTDLAEGLAQSIFRWNVRTGVVRPVIYTRGVVDGGGRYDPGMCGASVAALICVAAEADRPPRLEKIDLESGKRQVLFDPNAALAQDMAKATPARLLRWRDARGQEFTGQFFPAHNTSGVPAPLFVSYYTCLGFVRGGLGDEWPLASLAEDGISALCINHPPVRVDAVERYDQGLSAVRSVVDLLAAAGEVDRSRVGMGGLSFGTETTLWTAMYSDLLAAASVSSTPITPNGYLMMSMAGDAFVSRVHDYWQLGAPDEASERWRKISPVFNLDKIKTPILMQLPEQEYLHSMDYSIPLLRQHRADLYVFPNEPHLKFQPKHKLAVYERNVDWFRFWLQGIEDADPGKTAQYVHWRTIRKTVASESGR